MEKQKNKNWYWLSWIIAIILVIITAGSYGYVKHQEDLKTIKIAKQEKIDKKNAQINKKLLKEQETHMRSHIKWNESSETLPYPDISKYKHYKDKNRVWLSVSLKKQRLYVHQGPYTIYTMYAYANKNYQKMDDDQRTPLGMFKIGKNRGTDYYDAPQKYNFKAWMTFTPVGKGSQQYALQSVPVTQNNCEIKHLMKYFGKDKKRKHVLKTNGAIWLTAPDAKWLEKNIPAKTLILIQDSNDKNKPYMVIENYYQQLKLKDKDKSKD